MVQSEKSNIKLLIVLSSKDSMAKFLPSLRQYKYQIEVTSDINKAMESVKLNLPDVIMLSWNLKNISIVKMYTFFSDKLKLPCLVFPEDTSPRTTSSLMRSRIPHTIFPPLSAPGIHRRVEILLRGRKKPDSDKKAPKRRIRSSNKYGAIKILAKDIDSKTVWENVGAVDEKGDIAWRGTLTVNDSKFTYYFKGSKKPIYNSDLERWENLDEKNPILMQERSGLNGLSATQETKEIDENIFSLIQRNNDGYYSFDDSTIENGLSLNTTEADIQEDSLEDFNLDNLDLDHLPSSMTTEEGYATSLDNFGDTKPEPKLNEQALEENRNPNLNQDFKLTKDEKVHLQNILAKCVKSILVNCTDSSRAEMKKIDVVSRFAAITIPSNRFKGYLMVTQANNNLDTDFISKFYKQLQKQMMDIGEPLHSTEDIIQIEMEPFSFKAWANNSTEFIIAEPLNGQEIAFAFMELNALPHILEKHGEGFVGVNFKNWLISNTKLLFDLYLHMPANKKYILYLKKDTVISTQTVNKFLNLSVQNIFINPSQRNLFLEYCILNKIYEDLKKAS